MPITHKALHVQYVQNTRKMHNAKRTQSVTRVHRPTSWHALSIQPILHAFSKSMGRLFIAKQVR